jgi:hypothetical protein
MNDGLVLLRTMTARRSPGPVEPLVDVAVKVVLPVEPDVALPKLLATFRVAVAALSWKFCPVTVAPGPTTTVSVCGEKPVIDAVI